MVVDTIVAFAASAIISTIIIYIVTKIFGEKEGILTAFTAAVIGSIIYGATYYFVGQGLIAAIIGGVAWLLALSSLYKMGWGKSFIIALIIWIGAVLVGFLLPTLPGPL